MTPEEIQEKIRQKTAEEEIRRQEEYIEADAKFNKANQIYFNAEAEDFDLKKAYENFGVALTLYIEAKEKFSECGTSQFIKEKLAICDQMIMATQKQWAMKLAEEGDKLVKMGEFDQGMAKYRKALDKYPESITLLKRYQKLLKVTVYKKETSEKNILPEKSLQEYSIDVLFAQGVKLYDAKQYDKARDKFEEILALNPYHSKSIEYNRKIYKKMLEIGKNRYNTTRIERVTEAEWKLITPLIPRTMTGESMTVNEPIAKSDVESKIQEKLKNIIIDHIEFEEQTIPTVVKYLKQRSKQLDPEKVGVNIFLRLSTQGGTGEGGGTAEKSEKGGDDDDDWAEGGDDDDDDDWGDDDDDDDTGGDDDDDDWGDDDDDDDTGGEAGGGGGTVQDVPTVTMVVDDIPLGQALLYICRAANLKYRIEKYAIVIASQNVPLDDVETRIYPIEQEVVSEIGGDEDESAVVTFFQRRGINFPEGAKIVYDTRISRLIATNTPDNLNKIEEVIRELMVIDPQVLIQAKFVEISQNDLEELGFQYTFSRTIDQSATARNPRPTADSGLDPTDPASQGSRTTFGPNDDILRNIEDGGIGDTSRQDEVFDLSTISRDGYHFNWVVHALDQADSADLLSTPRVTTLNGQPATIRMVTEVYYPEEWSESEVSSDNVFVSSVPSFGEATELGIILNVTPNVDADNYTISLDMNPVVQEFAGWTDYSYQVTQEGVPLTNTLKMPQIAARTVETTVTIYDGETLILGGIIRDETGEILDKIPIIGDIPIIGRLFQSRAKATEKRNLLIFLTCRLVNPDGSPIRERELRGLPPFRQ